MTQTWLDRVHTKAVELSDNERVTPVPFAYLGFAILMTQNPGQLGIIEDNFKKFNEKNFVDLAQRRVEYKFGGPGQYDEDYSSVYRQILDANAQDDLDRMWEIFTQHAKDRTDPVGDSSDVSPTPPESEPFVHHPPVWKPPVVKDSPPPETPTTDDAVPDSPSDSNLASNYSIIDHVDVKNSLAASIKGQDHAIERVVNHVTVTMQELDTRPERPNGVFLLAGPTGTGKTEFAKALAEAIYGETRCCATTSTNTAKKQQRTRC